MSAELSTDEQIMLAYYEAQPIAPESFRYRIAKALFDFEDGHEDRWPEMVEYDLGAYGEWADIAISVMRGER